MAKLTLSTPDDPMYREGPQSYNPHWVRALPQPKTAPPSNAAAPAGSEQAKPQRKTPRK